MNSYRKDHARGKINLEHKARTGKWKGTCSTIALATQPITLTKIVYRTRDCMGIIAGGPTHWWTPRVQILGGLRPMLVVVAVGLRQCTYPIFYGSSRISAPIFRLPERSYPGAEISCLCVVQYNTLYCYRQLSIRDSCILHGQHRLHFLYWNTINI